MNKHCFASLVVALAFGVSLSIVEARAEDKNLGNKAAEKAADKTAAGKSPKKKSSEVSFDEVLVEGKYHFADEAVTTVEGDKVVDALLNVRTDFKDRIKKSASRH